MESDNIGEGHALKIVVRVQGATNNSDNDDTIIVYRGIYPEKYQRFNNSSPQRDQTRMFTVLGVRKDKGN